MPENSEVITFQFAIGISIAKMKAPSNGPEVVENAIIDVSITPEKKPTPNAIPITTKPNTTMTSLITLNCCLSVNPLHIGNNERKSSQITVEIEFKLETHMLQIERKYTL